MRLRFLPVLLLPVLAFVACNRKPALQSKEAVRQGVIDHLSKRPNLDFNQMQVDVASVNFHGNLADAVVSFKPKGSTGSAGMEMRYTLEQQGNRWVVKGRSDMGGAPHGGTMPGAMGQNPHGSAMPGAAGQNPSMGQMPEGHPPIGAAKPGPVKK